MVQQKRPWQYPYRGDVRLFGSFFCEGRIEFSNPEFEIVKDASGIVGFTGIVPVYLTAGCLNGSEIHRQHPRKLSPACERISPQSIIEKRGLPDIREALRMHRRSESHWKYCRDRLAYEEFLFLQTALVLRKERLKDTEERQD